MSSMHLCGAALALAGLPLLVLPISASACATCGCSLSADAAMGYTATAGWRVNLEYDFIDQNQLRSGYGPVAPSQVGEINAAGGDQEIERDTINRYLTSGISWSPDASWAATLLVPWVNRTHETWGSATPGELGSANLSGAHAVGLGDVKLIGNYQGLLASHDLGLQFGFKLPTGHYGGQNTVTGATVGSAPTFFDNGPAAGSALDTSLNPGNGSFDLIVGAYYHRAVSRDFEAFAQGQLQASVTHALDQPNADFRPGDSENFSFGTRYERWHSWTPQLQVNVAHKSPDQGDLADNTDTAGTVVYLSPGLSTSALRPMQVFAFVQRPVFSKLDGYQVFPHWTGSVGLSYSF